MDSWAHRTSRLESLINTVEAERYLRKPLLLDLLDELRATPRLHRAAEVAGDILARLPEHDEARLRRDLEVLRGLVSVDTGLGTAITPTGPRRRAS